ncbi:MAG: signal peptidase I [Chthoniobacterales bacterium]
MKSSILAVVLSVILLAISGCNRRTLTEPGEAMEPTIRTGETVGFDGGAYSNHAPERWDVVAFHPLIATDDNMMTWALRVVGLPGEQISFSTDGNVLVGGSAIQPPPRIASIRFVAGRDNAVVTVPQDAYYLVGDNPRHAWDSRWWGCLPRARIIGKVTGK